MRWKGRRQSENLEDRRGVSSRGMAAGGIGTILIVVLYLVMGGDPSQIENLGGASQSQAIDPADEPLKEFSGVVLADTEDVWSALFEKAGRQYVEPKLVLFSGQVESACGFASAAVGPFYCGEDQQVYLDMSFFRELEHRLGASGDFAQAYVIAHEVGHHVQKLMGTMDKVQEARQRSEEREANALSVRLELQADFYAGVWAHHARRMAELDSGDIQEALAAATAIGDDALQKQGQGYVVPDAFTHGTSEQRVRWFRKGWETGDPAQGDTFSTQRL